MIFHLALARWSWLWVLLWTRTLMGAKAMDIWSVASPPTSGDHGVSIHTMAKEELIEQPPGTNKLKYKSMTQQHQQQQRELWIPSPKCWQTAIAILQKTQQEMFSEDASELCARLPEVHQKQLALEIAQCHFQDLSRPLYMTESIHKECSYSSISNNRYQTTGETSDHQQQHLQYCLKHLTDAGVTVYTTYVAFVQNLCIRLTQELILHYQRETQQELALHLDDWLVTTTDQIQCISNLSKFYANQSADIAETVTQQMKDIATMYTEQLQTLSKLPDLVKDQLIQELTEHMGETFQTVFDEQLQETISKILTPHVQKQASFFGDLMDHLQSRDVQHQTLYDEWTHYQLNMMQQQALELQRQRQMLDENRQNMELWSATMKPLFGLNQLAQLVTNGYTWVTFVLHFLCTFLMVWVITRPGVCQPFRSLLFGVALSEAVLEMSFAAGVRYEIWTDAQRFTAITELRKWAFFVEAFLYISGLFVCGIFSIRSTSSSRTDVVVERDNPRVQHQIHELTFGQLQRGQDGQAWRSPMSMYAPTIDSAPGHPILHGRSISHHSAATLMPSSKPMIGSSPLAVYSPETKYALGHNVHDKYGCHPMQQPGESYLLAAHSSTGGGSTWITPPGRNLPDSRNIIPESQNMFSTTVTAPTSSDTEMIASQAGLSSTTSTLQPPQLFHLPILSTRWCLEDENAAGTDVKENTKDKDCTTSHNRMHHPHENFKRHRSDNDPEDLQGGKECKRPRVITAEEEDDEDEDEYEDAIGSDDFLPQTIIMRE
jgi:hypothetical protein